jgi:hypothetical protein
MHYLTQYYKNRCSQLQEQINFLNNRLQWLAEAAGGPTVGGGFSVGGSAEANEYGAAGSAGGSAPTGGQYSGAVLGNLLAAGDMSAVYQYLAQFYGNNPAAMSAIMASLGVNAPANAEAAGGSAPTTGGAFSGAQLGQLLGSGNMAAVNQYLSQFGPQSAGPSAPTGMTRRRR